MIRLSRIDKWLLRWICKRNIVQGWFHDKVLEELYGEIVRAARIEFYEDNRPTLDNYLKERHQRALDIIAKENTCNTSF